MRVTIFAVCILLVLSVAHGQGEASKKNKLVEFKGFDEWEIWCIDIEQSGQVECNLNQVLRYKDHPDFRALILRFYSDGQVFNQFKLDSEWQTSLTRGFIQVDDNPSVSLAECGSRCVLQEGQVSDITTQFTNGESAVIRIHDYVVQEFDISIELDQFALAAENLHMLAMKYR